MAKRDISFANFNLLNLNKPGEPIYSKEAALSEAEYQAKLVFSAGILKELDADVIGFQECWGLDVLEDVFRTAGLLEHYDLFGRTTAPRGIQVAIAARKGMAKGDAVWIDEFPEDAIFRDMKERRDAAETVSITIGKFSRPPLKLVLSKDGGPDITIFVVHLKSKGPSSLRSDLQNPVLSKNFGVAQAVASHVRRMVEAGALRIILDKAMKGNDDPFVVLGDLNDSTTAVSTELLSGRPGYRFFAKSQKGRKSDAGLYTVEKLQQLRSFRHVYYTYIFDNQMESLDHIMVSDAFYDNAAVRHWSFREMKVFNDHLTASDAERTLHGYNDHGIILARFDWNPMSEEVAKIAKKADETRKEGAEPA